MEKHDDIRVITPTFTWDDLGSWDALRDHLPMDANGVTTGGSTVHLDCQNSLFFQEEGAPPIAAIGVDGITIVVSSPESILVVPTGGSQSVKQLQQQVLAERAAQRMDNMADHFALAETLQAAGQSHLLAHAETLDPAQRETFLAELASIPWGDLSQDLDTWKKIEELAAPQVVDLGERESTDAELRGLGASAYADGKVAVLLVAGGMGSRLGFSGPRAATKSVRTVGKVSINCRQKKYWH